MLSIQENPHSVNGEMHDKSTGSEIGHNGGPPLEDSAFPSREGFVAIARALRDHWLVGFGQPVTPVDDSRGSYSRAEAWIDLIMECRYREGTINNNGKKMALRKGQLLGAVSWLANRWNWSPKTVRGFLDKLEKEGMITQTAESPDQSAPHTNSGRSKGRYANVLTVCKYELFQLAYRDAGQVPGLVKGKSTASTGRVEGDIYKEETKEQGNKGTKEKTAGAVEQMVLMAAEEKPRKVVPTESMLQEAFALFWATYPPGRKVAKGDALDTFKAIVLGKHKSRKATANEIIQGAKRYAATKPDPQYVPLPTTWLNGGRWLDVEEGTKPKSAASSRPAYDLGEDPSILDFVKTLPGGPNA